MNIDRRVIYLLLTLCIVLPLVVPINIPQNIMPQTKKLFDYIESIEPYGRAVLLSGDYAPGTSPENHPMYLALLRHCLARHVRVIIISLDPQNPSLALDGIAEVMPEFNRRAKSRADSVIYGRDYVYLGWKSGIVAAIMGMGESITMIYPRDYYQNQTDTLEMMKAIRNYRQVAIVVSIAGAAYPESYLAYGQSRYGVKVGSGVTAVMAADYYTFLQTGQFTGMLSGMKGAAEYEVLNEQKGYTTAFKRAGQGMDSQSLVHILIIVAIVLGNVFFFAERRKRK
jgi:hypothetical protein